MLEKLLNLFLVIQFKFLENRIKNQTISFVFSGICDEPVDPSIASQVIQFRISEDVVLMLLLTYAKFQGIKKLLN